MPNGEWKTMSLGEFAESIDYGVTASATEQPLGPKFLRITDIQDGAVNWENVPWCECDTRPAYDARLKAGDIVFARTGATTGKSFLIRECPTDTVFASYLIRVRVGDSAEPRFISHFFQTASYWAQIAKGARGVAQPGVNATTLKALQIPLPPLAEQRRIAEVLDRAEALRAKRRAALAQLAALTQSLFGDPATNSKGLPKESLEQLTLNITDGKHGDCRPSPDSGYFFVSVKDIKEGQIDYSEARQIERDDFMEVHRRTRLEVGDVLITNSGTIGKTAVVAASPELERTTFQKSVAIVKPRHERLESTYLKAALDMCVAKLSRESSGSSQKNLLLGQLRNFSVCVPPISLQREYARRVTAVEALKTAQRASLAELDALFATLQHRAFKGEL